jgi:PleD family two-component response regulator
LVATSFGDAAVDRTQVRFPHVSAEADAALCAPKRAGRNRVALAAA